MPVSVLIATRDRPDALARCVASVGRQREVRAEILVLDDGSATPVRVAHLEALAGGHAVKVFRSDAPLGVGAGRNLLMSKASGAVLCVLDDDAFFTRDDALIEVRDAFLRHPHAGILAFKIRDFRGGQARWLTPHGRRRTPETLDRPHRVSYYLGGGHAIRRVVIERCGLYPDSFYYGNEELDLSFRALDAGYEIRYEPTVAVDHIPPESTPMPRDERQKRLYHHILSRLQVAYTYLPAAPFATYATGWLMVYALRAVRQRTAPAFLQALRDLPDTLSAARRTPVQPATRAYLRAHYGRLWF